MVSTVLNSISNIDDFWTTDGWLVINSPQIDPAYRIPFKGSNIGILFNERHPDGSREYATAVSDSKDNCYLLHFQEIEHTDKIQLDITNLSTEGEYRSPRLTSLPCSRLTPENATRIDAEARRRIALQPENKILSIDERRL